MSKLDAGCIALTRALAALGRPLERADYEKIVRAVLAATTIEDRELEKLFDRRWEADMRAIKRWQAAGPGRELRWPDRADMVVWLLEENDRLIAAAEHISRPAGA